MKHDFLCSFLPAWGGKGQASWLFSYLHAQQIWGCSGSVCRTSVRFCTACARNISATKTDLMWDEPDTLCCANPQVTDGLQVHEKFITAKVLNANTVFQWPTEITAPSCYDGAEHRCSTHLLLDSPKWGDCSIDINGKKHSAADEMWSHKQPDVCQLPLQYALQSLPDRRQWQTLPMPNSISFSTLVLILVLYCTGPLTLLEMAEYFGFNTSTTCNYRLVVCFVSLIMPK